LYSSSYLIEASLMVQLSSVLIVIVTWIMSIFLSKYIGVYSKKNMLSLLLLNLFTMPAIVLGALLGFCRNKGKFYRTQRNIIY
jgi:ABC-type phosphate transport system permease subunit